MENNYRFYEVNGKRYKISEAQSSEFEKDFPSAKVNMAANGKKYLIDVNQRDEFLNDFGDGASYTNFDEQEEPAPKRDSLSSVLTSVNDSLMRAQHGANKTFADSNMETATSTPVNETSWGESFVKGAGAGFTRAGKGLLDALTILSSNNVYVDPMSANPIQMLKTGKGPELVKTPDYDTLMREKEDPMIKASLKMGEVADRLSMEADPTHGEKGFVDLIIEGKIGTALQKGLATGAESLPMTLSAYNPYTMALNMVSMAGANYAEETLNNPEVDKWKRATQAIGSAALEQAVEKFADPIFKYIGGGKMAGEFTEAAAREILHNVTGEATESIAKRILNVLSNTAEDALSEGGEEIMTSFGNDILGEALDLLDGDKDYGIRAQWEKMKEENPDANMLDFAESKAKEYLDSFIGGALSGAYMSGTTQSIAEGVQYSSDMKSINAMNAARELGASMNYGDMYDVDSDVNDAKAAIAESFVNETGDAILSSEFIDGLSSEGAFALSRSEDVSAEQRKALATYAIEKAKQESLNKKLDENLENNISIARARIEGVTENGQVISGIHNGRVVYVTGATINNGAVTLPNGENGPLVVVDSTTGDKMTVRSEDISSASAIDSEKLISDVETFFRTSEAQNRDVARNTMSIRAKHRAIQPFNGKKILIDVGNGVTEVFVQQISPKGEVVIKGKKGDLGGQSIITLSSDVFYDSIYRDSDGNPVVTEAGAQETEPAPETEVPQTPVETDFRDFTDVIIINGKPIKVDEVTSQDDVSNSITYRYTDENGVQRTANTTIGAFAEAVNLGRQQTETPAPEPTPAPAPTAEGETGVPPTEQTIDTPAPETAPVEQTEQTPVDWETMLDFEPENYLAEMQNRYGDKTVKMLNAVLSATQRQLDKLNKATPEAHEEILQNEVKKDILQARIDKLGEMVARLSTPVAPDVPADTTPVAETPVGEEPTPAPEIPAEPASEPTPAPVAETPEVPTEPTPVPDVPVVETPVAPNPVANPIDEARKKERQLALNLKKIGLSPEHKQDLAYNAGKAIADMFATREEYDAYAESATDFGQYNADFERGVDDSFAARNQQNAGNTPVNSVPLENEPNGENNGEQQPTSNEPTTEGRGSDTTGGGTNDGGNQEGGEGTQKTKSPRRSKGKKSGEQVEDKYPARKGNATQKLLVDTFGFESVTIPNARKEILNTIYDFMMEMSKTLGISPKSIGQGGWLSIGNMRSNKNAIAAHQIKSNTLTRAISEVSLRFKYARLSSIAHEWWHSLDRALGYFNTGKLEDPTSEVRETSFTGRAEVWEAVKGVMDAINNSGYTARIEQLVKRQTRAVREYFLRNTEQAARAFDEYITMRFAEAGITIDNYDNHRDDTQPTAEEMKVIAPAIENLFSVLKEKEGKTQGTSVLYHISEEMEPQSDAKKFATESILTALDDGNRDVVVMDDEQTKQYLKAIGADTDTQFSIDTDKPIFLSNAAIAVMGIKQEKATPEQWLKMIEKAGGLKTGEDKWMGLSDWLKASDKKTLTKQEVLDFINENTIRIEEVNYKQWDALDYIDEAVKILEAEMREIGWDAMVEKYPRFDELFEEYNGELMWSETRASVAEYEQFIFDEHNLLERPINDTRENYTTDGLDNKKEIAIIVPTIEPWGKSDVIHFGDAGDGRAVAWVRFGEARAYSKEYSDFYDFQKKMQQKYYSDRVIAALSDSDLEALTAEEREEFMRLRDIARSVPFGKRTNRRVLVIDEIQSKRHQDAREQGGYRDNAKIAELKAKENALLDEKVELTKEILHKFGVIHYLETGTQGKFDPELQEKAEKGQIGSQEQMARMKELDADIYATFNERYKLANGIPDAPFDKNWSELAMKRMLRYAAENGYDAVAWTKGEQQAERYNISKRVDNIDAEDSIIEEFEDGTPVAKFIHLDLASGESVPLRVDADGNIRGGRFHGNNLSDIIGKELAVKVMHPGNIRLSGEGLRVGGEGMKGFYDKMLPAFMNKYGKKWGVKVADITLPHVEEAGRVMHSVPVNDAMKESVMEGQPMFYKTPNGIVYGWTDGKKIYLTKAGLNPNTPIHEYTHLWAKAMMLRNPKGWESIKKLLKGTPVWNEVMNDVNYSNIHNNEDLVASEVLSRISGSENAAKMEQMAQKMIDEAKGTGRKLEARGLIQNMKDALNKFWNWVGTNLFGIENFESVEQVTDRVLYDLLNKTDLGELSEGQVETQIVTDPKVIAELEASPKRTGYRNVVQNEDGTFSSPMAYWLQSTKGGAKTRVETAKFELGKWEEAEEHPELVDEKGHVTLVKPNKSTVEVAYDPYIHNRLDPVNLQFKDAWKRDELVYVETEVPKTDLESGYHADKALLPVGVHSWSNGDLILSKYDKPVRIMPWDAVADAWVERLNGDGVHFDVVPPALRPLLVERGVEILPPHKGMGKDCNDAYKQWKDTDTLSREGDIVGFSESKDDFDTKVREAAKSVGIVREGLNSLLFSITKVDMHDFEGEHPADLARDWAKKNLVTTREDKENGTLPRMIDGTPYEISGNAISKYLSGKALKKSNDFDAHLSVLKELKNVIANSVDVEIHPDFLKEDDGSRTTNKYGENVLIHRLYGVISIDGRVYRVKTTMQEFRGNESNRPHSYEVTKIELLDSSMAASESATVNGERNPNNSISAAKLLNGVEKSYDKGKYLLEESKDIISYADIQNVAVDYLAGPQRNETIQRAVNKEAAKLGVSVTYSSREDMPKGLQNNKGYFNTKTGEIVICTENNASIADAIQTILHEAVAHKGLRQLMGDKFNEFINRVYDSLDAETKAKVDALAESKYNGNTAVAMEEYMASLAETENFAENSVWDKIKSAFENIINAILGRNDIKIGDNELRYILRASYNNMVNPRNMETIRGWARDQMMREDYKINHVAPELLSRTGIDPTQVATQTASLVYDQVVSDSWQEFQRQFQDAMQPVRIAIDAIQQETGNIPIEDYENYILIQNQSSSRSRVEIDDFARRYYSPIIEQVNKIIDTILESRGYDKNDRVKRSEVYKEVKTYLIAKHGLERNAYYQTRNTRKITAKTKAERIKSVREDHKDIVDQIKNDPTLSPSEKANLIRQEKKRRDTLINQIRDTDYELDVRDYSGLTALFGFRPEQYLDAEAEAERCVEQFENAVATDELWAKIKSATDKTLRHSYESGLLSRQQYNDIKNMFEFYIPLRGFDESTAEDVYAYARFEGNRFNPAVQKAEGRTSLADDPIAIIMNMAESEIAQGNKNRAKQALYNYLLNRSDGLEKQNSLMQIESVWAIKTVDAFGNEVYVIASPDHAAGETLEEFEERMQIMAEAGLAKKSQKGHVDVGMRFQKPSNKDAHYVYLKVNGVEKAIYINGNPKAADAINGTYAPMPSKTMQAVKDVQRLVSSTFTNYSLEFTARNYFRDMVYSHINISTRESDPAYRKKFRQNWRHNNMGAMLKMLTAYRAGELDGRPLTADEAAFVEFMNNGGQTGYTLINSVETHKKELERAIERMQKGIVKGGVKDTTIFRYTLGGIELLNEASELVTRFAAFKTSRDMGRGINRSISDAKEVTVNFNTKGAQDGTGWMGVVARYLGAVKYFFNASVQGVQNLGEAFQKNKLKFGTVVGSTIGLGMIMPILQGALSELIGGDEDEYWNIPEYDRQNNLCFVIGKGKYVKLPLPIGFREMYGLGDLMMAGILDKKFARSPLSVGMDVANKIATVVLPINPLEGSANGLSLIESGQDMLLPDFTQGMVQNRTNTDFKGVPIQKEYTYNENDPQWTKAFANNPAWLTGLSKWCYENIGIDGEGWDWSPEKLDNTLSNAFGGIYSLLKKTGRTVSAIWNEDNRTLSNVPLVGVIVGSNIDDDKRFVNSTYWEMDEYYNKRIYKIKSTAENFGLTLDEVFARNPEGERAGEHHPAMNKIYNKDYFDFMQEWYLGHKGEGETDENGEKILGLSQIKNKIKNLENKIKKNEDGVATPEQDAELVELNNSYEATRRDLVNDLLELD